MQAVVVTDTNGAGVVELQEVPDPRPGPGEVLVRVEAAGVNYHDIIARTGLLGSAPPFIAGVEGAGTIVEAGPGVDDLALGQRVAWPLAEGSFAELIAVSSALVAPIPDAISVETAAALTAQGVTAHYLATDAYETAPGHDVLVHAGAGGVGRLLVRLASHRGARVIATASTPQKADVAASAGAAAVFGYDDVVDGARGATAGRGVDVVYDGVGKATFEASLSAVRRRGHVVLYGATSGAVPPFDLRRLSFLGSPYLSRPALRDFVASAKEMRARVQAVFDLAESGVLDASVTGRFHLGDIERAHHNLTNRAGWGKQVLLLDSGTRATADVA
ncbi:quinone oxidoreductase family protein [Streptomyces sp. NPDC001351]|uniref:quinone oxidoreductase family protein n=1 Tax=Streptomyces sp. NPDC001351 TaxID=3364564 RepID=UPI00369B6916